MKTQQIYYALKPLIPRWFQIYLRRKIVSRKRILFRETWPIDEKACAQPKGWTGWPESKEFAFVLTHDVETDKGQKNCLKLMALDERYGFKSAFGFVPERYKVIPDLRGYLASNGFEVMVHGLYHDGKYYRSREVFRNRAFRINRYLKDWRAVGFRSPSMQHNLYWMGELDIEYDSSTFDVDPFEPQPDGVQTIFPFWVQDGSTAKGFVELPYTLPQDFTLFVYDEREKHRHLEKETRLHH
jgi:hypothetical protein